MQSGINLAWNRSNWIYSITLGMLHVIVTGVGAAMPSYSRTLLTSKWYIYLSGPFFYFHAFSVRVTLFVGICPILYLINLCYRFLPAS